MAALDRTDLKILALIEENSRAFLSQIAKRLLTSEQVVSYRMKSLEERGVLGGYYAIIDFSSLGYTLYRTMIRLSNIDDKTHDEIIAYLMRHTNTLWIVDCGGRWDLLINYLARNVQEYDEMLRELKKRFPAQVQNYDVLPVVEGLYFGRDYFREKRRDARKLIYLAKKPTSLKVSPRMLQILKKVSSHARKSALEIGKELGVGPSTVIARMRELEERGIIRGYKPLIHLDKTPFRGYKALLKFQNLTEKRERDLLNYLKEDDHVVGVIRLLGMWDFEIEFEVESREHGLAITRNIRDKFRDIIKEFETLALYREYKYDFFPGNILEKE